MHGVGRDREKLQEIAESINWVYAGLWQLSRDQRSVIWADGYYNGPPVLGMQALVPSSTPWVQRKARRRILEELQAGSADPNLTNNLSNTEWFYLMSSSSCFPLGTYGTPAKLLMTEGFDWVSEAGDASPLTFSRAGLAKATGIKTVLCLAVPGGVVELATTTSQAEDIALVQFVRNVFERAPGRDKVDSIPSHNNGIVYNSPPSTNSNSTPPVSTDLGSSLPETPRDRGLGLGQPFQTHYTNGGSVQPSVQVGPFGIESMKYPPMHISGLLRSTSDMKSSSPEMNLQQSRQPTGSWDVPLGEKLLPENNLLPVNLKHKLSSTAGPTRSGSCVASFEQALIHPHSQVFPERGQMPEVESTGKLLSDFQANIFKHEFPGQQNQNLNQHEQNALNLIQCAGEATVINSPPQHSQAPLIETIDFTEAQWRTVAQPRNMISQCQVLRDFHKLNPSKSICELSGLEDSNKRNHRIPSPSDITQELPDVCNPSNLSQYVPQLQLDTRVHSNEHSSYSSEAISPAQSEHEQEAEGGFDFWGGDRSKRAKLNGGVDSNRGKVDNHCIAERKRREKMNEKLHFVKSIVQPLAYSKDKPSVLGDVTKYMTDLERRVKESESTTTSSASDDIQNGTRLDRGSSLSMSVVDMGNYSNMRRDYHPLQQQQQQQYGQSQSGNEPILKLSDISWGDPQELESIMIGVTEGFPNIEVRMMENNQVMIKLSSTDRPGLFNDLLFALTDLRLQVQHANIRTVAGVMHNIFAAKVDVTLRDSQTTSDIAEAIRKALQRGHVFHSSFHKPTAPDVIATSHSPRKHCFQLC